MCVWGGGGGLAFTIYMWVFIFIGKCQLKGSYFWSLSGKGLVNFLNKKNPNKLKDNTCTMNEKKIMGMD